MARFRHHDGDMAERKMPSKYLIRRFIKYYRPYKKLFALDMICAVLHVVFALQIPYVTHIMFKQAQDGGSMAKIGLSVALLFVLAILMTLMLCF